LLPPSDSQKGAASVLTPCPARDAVHNFAAASELRACSETILPEKRANQLIASLGGDARAAVIQLVALVDSLQRGNEPLATAASRGFARTTFKAKRNTGFRPFSAFAGTAAVVSAYAE
jgi:hypothetical protein